MQQMKLGLASSIEARDKRHFRVSLCTWNIPCVCPSAPTALHGTCKHLCCHGRQNVLFQEESQQCWLCSEGSIHSSALDSTEPGWKHENQPAVIKQEAHHRLSNLDRQIQPPRLEVLA